MTFQTNRVYDLDSHDCLPAIGFLGGGSDAKLLSSRYLSPEQRSMGSAPIPG
jgi:hypothetical protein